MRFRALHRWDLSVKAAMRLQRELRERVVIAPAPSRPRLVAGADCAFSRDGTRVVSAVVVLETRTLREAERVEASAPLAFPYVPGLLSFREAPALLAAFEKLETVPDVVLFDGQGIAHPRRLGLATHLGLWLGLPTVGCAKSRLIGEAGEPGERRGSYRTLRHQGEVIGRVVRTRDGVRPLYVSPGHLADVPGAMRMVLRTGGGYRLPEPTRIADAIVNRRARGAEPPPARPGGAGRQRSRG